MPLSLRRPTTARLNTLVDVIQESAPTYREWGATEGALPEGYEHQEASVSLGSDPSVWIAGRSALVAWAAHLGAGVNVTPGDAPLQTDVAVVLSTRLGPFWMLAPCRIVYVTDEPNRYGFAYGTLPGHPETGEESFHVTRRSSGIVTFEIRAFSRPASFLARLGGPITPAMQRRATQRYINAFDDHIRSVL